MPGNKSFDRWVSLIEDAGKLLSRKGKYNEAAVLSRRVLEGRERALGKDHPDTLTSVNNLA
ncbi:hypothetical protein EJ04DRAFT_440977, partial [Polyplosphaeria fusca]